jgi:hypothetical protein
MNVKVGSGTTKLDGYCVRGTVAGQGCYVVRLDAATETVAAPATDPTNPARYGVYLFVNDTAYGGTAARAYADITCLRGTPAGSRRRRARWLRGSPQCCCGSSSSPPTPPR